MVLHGSDSVCERVLTHSKPCYTNLKPLGDTTVALASVSGPIEVRLASELPSQATFDVSVRPLSNVPSTESKSQASAIRSALAPSLILNKNPRTLIQLVIQTLSPIFSSGPKWMDGLLAAMINASTLALLNAGSVPMRGVVCAIAVGKTEAGELLVDPEDNKTASLVQGGCFAFMIADGIGIQSNSTSVWTNWRTLQGGTFTEADVAKAREVARDAIGKIYATMKSSFLPDSVVEATDEDKMEI